MILHVTNTHSLWGPKNASPSFNKALALYFTPHDRCSFSGLTGILNIYKSRYMEKINALDAFAALSQTTRLDVFRLLIKAGEDGMSAGEISETLGVRQNTMPTNLGVLNRAGMIRSARNGRSIRYFADMDGLRGLLAFLMEDCCGGHPEMCQPIINELACAC